MARYKGDPADNDYRAGDDFNYEVWTANTEITLCNVPWDAVYKDVWQPDSVAELNKFIDESGDMAKITNAMYARVDEPISIDMPLGRAQRYNYVRVLNRAQPVPGNDVPKYYYYFIRGVIHESPNTTRIIVQLDVWQTYIRLVQFGRAYIESGHIGIANKDNFRGYGRDFLTVPDGLNIGTDYVNVVTKRDLIMQPWTPPNNNGKISYNVMAISTVDLQAEHGTRAKPENPSARPELISGIPSGAGVYFWETPADFMAFMADFSKKPWVTGAIVSITLVPDIRRWADTGIGWGGAKDPVTRARKGYNPATVRRDMFKSWRKSADILNYIPARYRHLKKFLTSPYCMIEMSFNAGSAVVLKPESWNSEHASIVEMANVIPPDQRLAAIPLNYNGRNPTANSSNIGAPYYTVWDKDGDFLDMAIFLTSFPTIPIVNNGQIAYLASNARSIAAQYSSNDWSQQKALTGNQMAFDQASAGINAGIGQANNAMAGDAAQVNIANNLAAQQALLGLFSGATMGAAGGALAGPAGLVGGAFSGAASGVTGMLGQGMSADAANQSLAARTGTAGTSRDISAQLGTFMRDSNKGLADWAAKGDYANARGAIDAKVQDAAMIPHGMSGQFGGETFNLVTGNMELTLRFKMIDQAALSVIGEYWLRYGYPVRRAARIPNDLRVMDKFSYWKMSEVYILNAAMPESHKQTLRGILEKGVTVWTNPRDMGMVDFADNRPLPNIVIEGYEPPPWTPEPDPVISETKKRKKKKMLVYATNDGGMKYALAGTSPGTTANFIVTDSAALAGGWMEACGVDAPVMLEITKFYELQTLYTAPVSTLEYVEGVGA